jgi:hypothetical protein
MKVAAVGLISPFSHEVHSFFEVWLSDSLNLFRMKVPAGGAYLSFLSQSAFFFRKALRVRNLSQHLHVQTDGRLGLLQRSGSFGTESAGINRHIVLTLFLMLSSGVGAVWRSPYSPIPGA